MSARALVLALALVPATLHAQAAEPPQRRATAWTLTALAGSAPWDATAQSGLPVPPLEATFVALGFRWERTVWRDGAFDLRFAAEAWPVATLRGAVSDVTGTGICTLNCAPIGWQRRDATGVGAAPIGLTAEYALGDRVALVASSRTALAWMSERVPLASFSQPLYLLEGSLGARVRVGEAHAVTLAWTRASIANGAFILDDRAMKAGGLTLGFGSATDAPWPRGPGGPLRAGWMLTAGAGEFSPVRGFTTGAQLATVTWRWERVIVGDSGVTFRAGVEALPLVVGRANKLVLPANARCAAGPCPVVDSYGTPVVGVGIAPIALRAETPAVGRVRLWLDGAAGGVAFDRPYPIREANRLNFLIQAGAGITVPVGAGHALVAGYRLQHLSNGFTADRNPGVNYHALTAALTLAP